MADLEDIATALALADKGLQERNTYFQLGNIADQVGASIGQSGPQFSTKDKIVTSLATGLLGGLFQNMGQDQYASQKGMFNDALMASLRGSPLKENPGIPSSIFSTANDAGSIFRAKREFELADKVAESGLKSQQDMMAAILKDPYAARKGLAMLAELKGGTSPIASPAGEASAEDLMDPTVKAIAGEEDQRRKEIEALAPKLRATTLALPALEQLAGDDTGTSDIPFIYQFVQAQDGGVVKEGEIALVEGASPLLTYYKAQLEGALNGQSTLTPAIKQQMVSEMKQVAQAQYVGLQRLAEPILKIGEARGAKRDRMFPFDQGMEQMWANPESAQPQLGGGAATQAVAPQSGILEAAKAEKARRLAASMGDARSLGIIP